MRRQSPRAPRRVVPARRLPFAVASVVALVASLAGLALPAVPASATGFPAPPPPPFHAISPARLLDTRIGPEFTTIDGSFKGAGPRPAFSTLALTVAGRASIPADAAAVALNVTVTGPTGTGFVTVHPCGAPLPNASSVNVIAGQVVANAVVAKVGTNKQVCLYTTTTTDLVVDVTGYFPAAATFLPVTPARLLETRSGPGLETVDGLFQGGGRRAAGSTLALTVSGRGGVPGPPAAVSLNVTVTGPDGAGFVTVFPCGSARPNASNVNFVAGQVVPNAVIAKVPASGQVCVFTSAATDLLVDVNGSFPPDATFVPLPPARLVETRSGPGLTTVDGQLQGGGLRPAWSPLSIRVLGRGGVLPHTRAVVLNVTVTEPTATGFATVYPCGGSAPNASTLNFVAGQVVANAVIADVGPFGEVCVVSNVATHLVVDVNGAVPASDGWPASRYDAGNTGFNATESEIHLGNASKLRLAATTPIGTTQSGWGPPVVSEGTVFVSGESALVALRATGSGPCSDFAPRSCPPSEILWTADLAGHRLFSAPTVANGFVYAPTFVGLPGNGSDELFVFDAHGNTGCGGVPRTCTPLWTAPVGGSSPATVHDGLLYVSGGRNLWAVDANGVQGCGGTPKVCQPLWMAQLLSDSTYGGMSAPAIDDAMVYAIDYRGTVYAYDAHGTVGCSGVPVVCAPRWTSAAISNGGSGPFLGWTGVVAHGGRVFRYSPAFVDGSVRTTVAAFDAAGAQGCAGAPVVCNPVWVAPIAGAAADTQLAVAYGMVFAMTLPGGSDTTGQMVTALAEDGAGCTTGPTSCPILWSSSSYRSERFAYPVVANGLLYVRASPGFVVFDATGSQCSFTHTNCGAVAGIPAPTGLHWGNVAIADGRLYAFSIGTSSSVDTGTVVTYELCPQCIF